MRRVEPVPLVANVYMVVNSMPENSPLAVLDGPLKGLVWRKRSPHVGFIVGDYEPNVQEAMKRAVHQGDVVYDLGAHHGFHSALAAILSGPTGRVFAFEMRTENLIVLHQNMWANELDERVTIVPCAVSDKSGMAEAHFANKDTMWGKLTLAPGDPEWLGEAYTTAQVRTVTLDEYVYECGNPKPDALKIDVEGAESSVLRGGQMVIRQARPTMVLSIHGEKEMHTCMGLLASFGYAESQIETVTKGDILLVHHEALVAAG